MTDATEQPLAVSAPPSDAKSFEGEVELQLSDIEGGLASLPRAKVAQAVSFGGGALVIAMVAYRWNEGKDHTMLAVIGLSILVLLFLNRNPARKIAKRVYASLPPEARRISVRVSDEGITLRSSGAETELEWSQIWKLNETRNVVVVFTSRQNAQILPKRAFSESQLVKLRTLAKERIVQHTEPFLTPELTKRLIVWTVTFAIVWMIWYLFGRK
jgi:hypothetical protein